jgi:2',3'-cyclic-nucleotide 2'-phosphodiesterase (5'-nucleotidase family)
MKKRTFLSLLLSLVMLVGIALPTIAEQPAEGKLYILHTNDIHGRAVADPQAGILGYAAIARYKKDLEAQGHAVLLLDAGDASQGTPLVNLGYGKNAIEFMNAAGYDAMAPGNHEFDWGTDNLKQLQGIANFPLLAANILDTIGGEVTFRANTIFNTSNGLKVGVFGLTTPETATRPTRTRYAALISPRGRSCTRSLRHRWMS